MLNFWIEKGVDGFRMDAVAHIFEDAQYRDETPHAGVDPSRLEWFQMSHVYTLHQPATLKLLDDWADYLYHRGIVKDRQL